MLAMQQRAASVEVDSGSAERDHKTKPRGVSVISKAVSGTTTTTYLIAHHEHLTEQKIAAVNAVGTDDLVDDHVNETEGIEISIEPGHDTTTLAAVVDFDVHRRALVVAVEAPT